MIIDSTVATKTYADNAVASEASARAAADSAEASARATADAALVPKSVAVANQDLIIGTGSATVGRLAKGGDNTLLQVVSGVITWVTTIALSLLAQSGASTGWVIRWAGSAWAAAQLAFSDLAGTASLAQVPEIPLQLFGDGRDGDVTITTNNATIAGLMSAGALTRDAYFHNLTISGAGSFRASSYRIFVSGTLTIDNAGAAAIHNDSAGNGGAGGATGTAGANAGAIAAASLGQSIVSNSGGAGGTGVGSAGASTSAAGPGNGGGGANGGAGGAGSGGAGGGAGSGGGATAYPFGRVVFDFLRGTTLVIAGGGGAGGGGGGGDGTAGGGGGGGSPGAGAIAIYAATISRGASTAAGAISCKGKIGGAGGSPTAGNRGGGGGGGGGSGGWIYLVYGALTGATATNALDVSGGTGGAGGNGFGTGVGGTGGQGAPGGRITVINATTGALTETFGGTATNGSGPTGVTGGAGGAGQTTQVSL